MANEVAETTAAAPATAPAKPTPLSPEERARKRMAALKFTDDGRPATLAELGDARRELSNNERIKLEKPGPQVWKDVVERYATGGFESIDADDFERFKWIGLYQQRPKDGHFMLRIKLPGGWVTNERLRAMASITRDYARNIADISTRQAFQMHWLTIDQIPDIMDRLGDVGLGVKHGYFGACGDICRNIISSPLTGIDAAEVIDPTDFVEHASKYFATAPEYADMPRKFKVGVFGNRSAGQCEINELSMYGVRRSDGRVGYGVMVGGGLSTEPHLAQDLSVFVAPEQAFGVMEAVTRIYRDHGYRKNRKHARLKYLIADWGAVKVRDEVEKILGYKLEDAEPQPHAKGYEDKLGVHAQSQDGLSFVGVPVVAGRLTADQMYAIADIAQEFATGDIRLTVMQNFYIINIPNENVAQVVERLNAIGLPIDTTPVLRGVVACTGIEFCNLAVTETKNRAKNIVNLLDEGVKWSESEFFRVNVNGCPNSCGQHWIADVGLQGCTKKIDGVLVEHFDVFLGGALGSDARFNRRIKRVTAEEVAPAIQKLIDSYQQNRQGEETFAQWVERHSDEELDVLF
jgi:sulfite reductase beta subunit-like hemoprotein